VPRNGTIADVLVGLQTKANLDDDTIRNVRIYETSSGKIHKELDETSNIAVVNELASLYAERIPEEELKKVEDERTINAFNFDREPNKPYGVPFKFVVKPV
jgi:ubiquitin carboxyl-terminal hydrolase 7